MFMGAPANIFKTRLMIHMRMMMAIALVIMATALPVAGADIPAEKNYPKVFRFGALKVLDKVNSKDAQVIIEMLLLKHNKENFPKISAELEIIPDIATASKLFKAGRLHAILLSGIDYLILKQQVALKPLVISSRHVEPVEAYVLVTQKRVSSLEQLAALSHRRLIAETADAMHIATIWLDGVLDEMGHDPSQRFFTNIRSGDKPTRIVLPVFFDQAEACLVPEKAFKTMIELNPQIGRRLHVLHHSPGFIRYITCVRPDVHPEIVDAMMEDAVKQPNTPTTDQMKMIFQYESVHLFDEKYIQATKKVYHHHQESANIRP